jgi:MFS family permease
MLKSYSPRFVNITGTLLTAFGLITSSFSTKMWHLLSYAIFVGFGLGLIQSATFIAVNSYFSTKRGQAVGFAMAGTGLGQMLMPNITGFLLETYTFRGATLAIGALALHGVM